MTGSYGTLDDAINPVFCCPSRRSIQCRSVRREQDHAITRLARTGHLVTDSCPRPQPSRYHGPTSHPPGMHRGTESAPPGNGSTSCHVRPASIVSEILPSGVTSIAREPIALIFPESSFASTIFPSPPIAMTPGCSPPIRNRSCPLLAETTSHPSRAHAGMLDIGTVNTEFALPSMTIKPSVMMYSSPLPRLSLCPCESNPYGAPSLLATTRGGKGYGLEPMSFFGSGTGPTSTHVFSLRRTQNTPAAFLPSQCPPNARAASLSGCSKSFVSQPTATSPITSPSTSARIGPLYVRMRITYDSSCGPLSRACVGPSSRSSRTA